MMRCSLLAGFRKSRRVLYQQLTCHEDVKIEEVQLRLKPNEKKDGKLLWLYDRQRPEKDVC